LLGAIAFDAAHAQESILTASWRSTDGRRLHLLANLSDAAMARPGDWKRGPPIWGGEPGATLPPWAVFWSISST
jgi:1,4-alpha-glucan branching enzyme/maltooligosyltrehalose trehalohydrolase